MKRDVILAGVGGQGLLSIAAVIGHAALSLGLDLRQCEVHGMAQRGGVVQSHIRYSDARLYSDLVREGSADLVLSLEPMEGLRYLPFLRPDGILVTNSVPVRNIPDYPDLDRILAEIHALPQHRIVDAAALATEAGSVQCANLVLLGAAAPFLALPEESLEEALRAVFAGKPPRVVETNVRGFRLGVEASRGSDQSGLSRDSAPHR
jgi:indolepyruvate ferredoxin oxidoreductase beta subunit